MTDFRLFLAIERARQGAWVWRPLQGFTVMRDALAARARSIARDIGRLHPDWQHPERYFERRDELRRQLQQVARAIEQAGQ